MKIFSPTLVILLLLLVSACAPGPDTPFTHLPPETPHYQRLAEELNKEPVSFEIEQNVAIMRGILDSSLPRQIETLLQSYPEVDTLMLEDIRGSIDLIATYQAGQIIREACLTTVVPEEGFIASGGVSLFLAGCERTAHENSKIVVHSWRQYRLGDDGEKTIIVSASELDRNDPAHTSHLAYLYDMLIPEAFYWYSVDTPFDEPVNLDAAQRIGFELLTF